MNSSASFANTSKHCKDSTQSPQQAQHWSSRTVPPVSATNITMVPQFLLDALEWLAYFEFANPWTHPWWAFQDLCTLIRWGAEDYLFISPIFRVAYALSWYVIPIYLVNRFFSSFDRFMMLGRGRQDPGMRGYLTHAFLEFLIMRVIRFDVLSEPYIHPWTEPYNGQLGNMPQRGQARPRIIGVDPFKQEVGNNGRAKGQVLELFRNLRLSRPQMYAIDWSTNSGLRCLKARLPEVPLRERINTLREWDDEIAHVRSCGAVVINLHPRDAAEVIQKGWGQRHPLCAIHESELLRGFYHSVLGRGTPVSRETVIIYAHLSDDQYEIVAAIIAAAVWWTAQHQ